jgi:hypothetical protein
MRGYPRIEQFRDVSVRIRGKQIDVEIAVKQTVNRRQHDEQRNRLEVTDALAFDIFPNRMARTQIKFLDGIKDSGVEMEKPVLYVVPDEVDADFFGIAGLPAMAAEIPFERAPAIFTLLHSRIDETFPR